MRKYHTFALLIALLSATLAPAAMALEPPRDDVEIFANQLEVRTREGVGVFSGNVKARHRNIELNADTVTAYYTGQAVDLSAPDRTRENVESSLQKIVATGNLKVKLGEDTATGKAATYNVASNTVILDGGVTLKRGTSVVKAEELTYDVATGRVKLGGSAEGVRARFIPADLEENE